MLSENARKLESSVIVTLPSDHRPTEADVKQSADALRHVFAVPDDEFDDVLRALHAKLVITLAQGTSITETDYRPWLNERKASIDPFYWERYRKLLVTKLEWPPLVVNALDRVADDILDLAGDPREAGAIARKGLVVGDVQSGKTATYTALACKAADAGYKLIVLLTGTIESLRRQTQERLDEGFVGRDSFEMLQKSTMGNSLLIGVGLLDKRHFATVLTSRSRDFSIQAARQLSLSIRNGDDPVLLVCKKHPSILKNLRTWLQTYNAEGDEKINVPLLLVDDEADNASINTRKQHENATRTNSEIRSLLGLFERSSYVGVTATPFANVFINPDTEEGADGDLFPRDFIYSLEAPNNYVGPERIFDSDDDESSFLKSLDDAEPFIPASHRSDFRILHLPPSLHDAIRSFLLTTTIRDLRGEALKHRSMLINISRFTNVQNDVVQLVDAELREYQREIRLYGSESPEIACANSARLASLRAYWAENYDTSELDWTLIQKSLNASIQPIITRAVNVTSGPASLDYKAHREAGLRVIAIGGNSLSRGLTLEGLSTSYFYRHSHMYDTLLQMGRWFGYRINYEDLCRLWLTDDAASWYAHITTATMELREELKRMKKMGLTPKDFGLKVRAHPDSLIVTARNKMRYAEDFEHFVSLSAEGLETTRLRLSATVNTSNYSAALRLINAVQARARPEACFRKQWHFWRSVPVPVVASFLKEFESDLLNFNLNLPAIADYLASTTEAKLQEWDVALVSVRGQEAETVDFAGLKVSLSERYVKELREFGALLISGTKRRVGTPGDEAAGLTEEQLDGIRREYVDKNIPGSAYRLVRARPLLLLYLIRGSTTTKKESPRVLFRPDADPLVAFSLSFPKFDDSDVAKRVKYKVNSIYFKPLFAAEADEDDDEIDDVVEE